MTLSHDAIDKIYKEIAQLNVSLDLDPMEFTPARLQEKIAQVRSMQSQTERWFVQASSEAQKLRREKHKMDALIKIATADLMIRDPDVRMGRSVREREMLAQDKLQSEVQASENLTADIQEVESLLIVIKAKRSDLKDISRAVREQVRLCKDEMDVLGRTFKGKHAPLSNTVPEASLDDLENLLKAPPAPKAAAPIRPPEATVTAVHGDVFDDITPLPPPSEKGPAPLSALEEDEDLSSFLADL